MKQKGWHSLSICMWTGLACLRWLKQCRSNLEYVLLSILQAQATSHPWKKPANRKDVPPEAGKNMAPTTHQPLVPACSKHPQHYGAPQHFHTLLCRGNCWQRQKTSTAGAGEHPPDRLVPLALLCKALHCGKMSSPLGQSHPHRGKGSLQRCQPLTAALLCWPEVQWVWDVQL